MYNKNEFLIFAYHAVCDDWWAEGNGENRVVTRFPSSLTTPETVKLYKDAGFNVMFVSYVFEFCALEEDFQTSKLKAVMDMAWEQGLPCIVFIKEIHRLSSTVGSLIDPEKADGEKFFASEEELTAYVGRVLQEVKEHPAFFGCSIKDEPLYSHFKAQGQVWRAIRTVCPNAYVNANLLPYSPELITVGAASELTTGGRKFYAEDERELVDTYGFEEGSKMAYRKYLQLFYDEVKPEIMQYDDYPIRERGPKGSSEAESYLLFSHIVNAQIVADFCKEKGLQFSKVFQTCGGGTSSKLWRKPSERDMYWQIHIGMAMGIKGFSYWSYYPVVNSGGEFYDETASFVDRKGEPNETYYVMQKLHNEMRAVDTMLKKFDYQAMKLCVRGDVAENSDCIRYAERNGELSEIKSIRLEREGVLLITEMRERETGRKGYWVVNATDPILNEEQTAKVEFENFNEALIYRNGVERKEKFENNVATFVLRAGQGVFVLPY